MTGNFLIKNVMFSVSGINTPAELVSGILGGKNIFSKRSGQRFAYSDETPAVSGCRSLEEYFEKAEKVLTLQKECIIISEFDEGYIAFSLADASSSEGYALLRAEKSENYAEYSLRDAFFEILKAVLEIRFYTDLDTAKYRNLVFSEFPYRKKIILDNLAITFEETEVPALVVHRDSSEIIPVSFADEEELRSELSILYGKAVNGSLHSIAEEYLCRTVEESDKSLVFCIKTSEELLEQIRYVSGNSSKFLHKNYLWKTATGSFYLNSDEPVKVAFCNPPGGMYNRETFFKLYTMLGGSERDDNFLSWNVVHSDNGFTDRYLYDVINTHILLKKLLQNGISADFLSGMSMGEISYFINSDIIRSKDTDLKSVFTIISSVISEILEKQYKLAEKYFGKKPDEWSKYYVHGDVSELEEIIKKYKDIFIIITGSTKDMLVCGEERSCTEVFSSAKCTAVRLDEPFFIHTPVLASEKENIKRHFLAEGIYADASMYGSQLFSTASAEEYRSDPEWFAENIASVLTEPVNYPAALEKLYDLGTKIFVDISTNQVCSAWVKETLKNKKDAEVVSLFPKKTDNSELFAFAARLISCHVRFDKVKFFRMFGYDLSGEKAVTVNNSFSVPDCRTNSPAEAISLSQSGIREDIISTIINRQLDINSRAYSMYLKKQEQLYSDILAGCAGSDVMQKSMSGTVRRKDCLFDRDEIVEMTSGSLSAVLGEKYREADNYAVRARMPLPPFLFADRIISLDAEFGKLRPSEIVTEYTVRDDCVFRNGERKICPLIMSEAAHTGIFLMSYIGIDIISKGTLAFRAVDTAQRIINNRPLYVGDTIRTVFKITKFMKNGSSTLLFYTLESCINGEPVAVSNATGGFFTKDQLSSDSGIIEKFASGDEVTGETFPYTADLSKKTFEKEDLIAFYKGEDEKCFGTSLMKLKEKYIENPAMYLVDRITDIDFKGGRYHSGYICGEKQITPDMWYFDVHFKNDPVLPAVISINGAEQTMLFFLAYSGLLNGENTVVKNAEGNVQKSKFRGQVRRAYSTLRYECHIRKTDINGDRTEITYDADIYNNNVRIMKLENNKKVIEKGE